MSEFPTQTAETLTAEDYWGNLEKVSPLDAENVRQVVKLIEQEAKSRNIEVHVLAVGGTVDPAKRGQRRKDIDLVIWSPDLAIETTVKGGFTNFGAFSGFLVDALGNFPGDAARSFLVKPPQIDKLDNRMRDFDGSVEFHPPSSGNTPIEFLPIRKNQLGKSLEEYLQERSDPTVILL